eukprot:symbB.v1.2.012399.t4/scaffold857.1/size218589/14
MVAATCRQGTLCPVVSGIVALVNSHKEVIRAQGLQRGGTQKSEELGSFCCTTGHELKRKIFALPRRNSVLRQADPRTSQLVGQDGLIGDEYSFCEDSSSESSAKNEDFEFVVFYQQKVAAQKLKSSWLFIHLPCQFAQFESRVSLLLRKNFLLPQDQDLQLLLGPRTCAVSALRCRPQTRNPPVQMDTAQGLVSSAEKIFELDYAFDETASGSLIFEEVWQDAVQKSLSGRSAVVLAYGPAGSGKNHSLFGEDGLVVKTSEFLEASLGAKIADVVRVEFFDLERDRTSDLLQEDTTETRLRVRFGKEMSSVEGVEPYALNICGALEQGMTRLQERRRLSAEKGRGLHSMKTCQLLQLLRSQLAEGSTEDYNFSRSLTAVSQVLQSLVPKDHRGWKVWEIFTSTESLIVGGFVPWRESAITMLMANVLRREFSQLIVLGHCCGEEPEMLSTLRFLRRARQAMVQVAKKKPKEAE